MRENNIKALNVAGSRGSKEPKVASFVKEALEEAKSRLWSLKVGRERRAQAELKETMKEETVTIRSKSMAVTEAKATPRPGA